MPPFLPMSDDEESIVAASNHPNTSAKRKAEAIDLSHSEPEQTHPTRAPLAELTQEQFLNRLRGPKAWVKRPKYHYAFLQQWKAAEAPAKKTRDTPPTDNRALRASVSARARHAPADDMLCEAAHARTSTSVTGKPRRRAAQCAFDLLMRKATEHLESSDDEIVAPTTAPTRVAKRKMTTRNTAESDYDEGGANVLLSSEVSDNDREASEESDTAQTKPKAPGKSKKTSPSNAKSSAKSSSASNRSRAVNLLRSRKLHQGPELSLPPIFNIDDIFEDLTSRALALGFDRTVHALFNRPIRVATMCSGTESPLLALGMIGDALKSLDHTPLSIEHLFSAEIVPYKQAYIERNFHPPMIFRDITELTGVVNDANPMATTAFGAKAAIPGDVDLVIAGTSCVDFSAKNKHRKGLEDGGESADTFQAVLSYAQAYRPSIVILENVLLAPYDSMMAKYEDIGYETASVLVDTKNHYIPHTRQRGYMACFLREKVGADRAAQSAQTWVSLMDRLKRSASSPVSSFLLPNDEVNHRLSRTDVTAKEVDWSRCEITQMEYRHKKKLGVARPLTNWTESGSILPPDHSFVPWLRMRVERELDTLDVAMLRKAMPEGGGYDALYKSRVWDISQNVYRDEDKIAFGIIGCLTPTGRFFISDACRPLDARETLILQGIPLSKISFTTETPAEIQDLAGNAMSSTLIGTSIIAALMAGTKSLQTQGNTHQPTHTQARDASHRVEPMHGCSKSANQTLTDVIDMSELIRRGEQSLRRCDCEGSAGVAEKLIQRCKDCGHTTCISCGGNPKHNFVPAPLLSQGRSSPASFERYVRDVLPLQLAFSDIRLPAELPKHYLEAVSNALNARFRIRQVRRTHCWTIVYDAEPYGRLELVIEGGQSEWRLYALPDKKLPGNDKLRTLLEQPILRGNTSHSFQGTDWQFRVPQPRQTVPMTVHGSGRQIASWRARLGLPAFQRHTMWERLSINGGSAAVGCSLDGVYSYLPHCGTACEGLYMNADGSVYLFLDPQRIGDASEDCYVFSRNKTRLEYDETRPVFARVAPGWVPWSSHGDQAAPEIMRTKLYVDDVWQNLTLALSQPQASIEIQKPISSQETEGLPNCTIAKEILRCTVANESLGFKGGRLFTSHAWVFEAMRRHLADDSWHKLSSEDTCSTCETCAPSLPTLRWRLSNGEVSQYEDPIAAAEYERTIKARPEPIIVQTTDNKDGTTISLGVNFLSLAHRAISRLQRYASEIHCEKRFITSSRGAPFVFKPFRLLPTHGLQPCPQDLGMSVQLFPKQLQVVSWMKLQEHGTHFELEETEESSLPPLGWRAEVRARATVEIRGGVCADHPGFGKTITSLALIQSQLLECNNATIINDLEARQARHEATAGLIPLAATLIVCPMSLQAQWIDEIQDKIGTLNGVLSVTSAASLNNITRDDFNRAKIIVVNRSVLASDPYVERLAAFAAMPGPATSGHGHSHWLDFALKQVPEHLEHWRTYGESSLSKFIRQKYRDNVESQTFQAAVPSRRLRGKDYVANKAKKSAKTTDAPAAKEVDTRHVGRPLFEMFFFNRVIVDEFHQLDPKPNVATKEHAAICALRADKKWLLSGTPAVGDFYEVAQMAKLLGVPLHIGSDDRGVMKAKSISTLRKTMTDFERFNAARQRMSSASHSRLYDQHRKFLDTFVRQNIMDLADLTVTEHLVPVVLDPDHAALYAEKSQQFNSLDMRIKKKKTAVAAEREGSFDDVVRTSSTAEEALSKAAAFFDRSVNPSLDALVTRRREESKATKDKIPASAAVARTKEPDNFKSLLERIKSGEMGDQHATAEILETILKAKPSSKPHTNLRSDEDSDSTGVLKPAGGGRDHSAALLRLSKQLVKSKRSARYLLNLMALRRLEKQRQTCDHPGCNGKDEAHQFAVSILCGHKICQSCRGRHRAQAATQCPAQDCSSSQHEFHLLWVSKLAKESESGSPYGAKLQSTMSILRAVREKGEQAILFVQFEPQLREAQAALDDAGISSLVVHRLSEAGALIQQFRESASTGSPITVIVLNASDETAAGSNLQNANHVIFLSPLLRDTQYSYEATNAQAIGRVRRHGQKRDIHVYRLAALHTIDVDILEHRERRSNAIAEPGEAEIEPPQLATRLNVHGEPIVERTQLVCEDAKYSLRPQSWLVRYGADKVAGEWDKVKGKSRILGWEDFSSLLKFSGAYTEDD
ncbi:hypothetical protein AC579_7740 [Pseudocercospora musae]|uniref:Helicase C-terminal domain-containing protein n=1 Tax=Pseudocercospora musae TaxID=113226 RepID=A0A139IK13_9PEZI|nr:hypothetical protein AC579_7740 [Pseudocercospora musae]